MARGTSQIRPVKNEMDAASLIALIQHRAKPFTATLRDGLPRTNPQNHLQRKWCGEVAEQLGDRTAEEVRGETKLRCGVPILRRDDEAFCAKYDRLIKPHTYEEKLEMMMEPIDFPISRLLTTAQKTEYLDAMFRHWTAQGVILTMPEGR